MGVLWIPIVIALFVLAVALYGAASLSHVVGRARGQARIEPPAGRDA